MILLPTADLENTRVLADKLRIAIAEMEIDSVGQITASFGLATVREMESMEELVARADKALYHAKNNGRNCVKTELDI